MFNSKACLQWVLLFFHAIIKYAVLTRFMKPSLICLLCMCCWGINQPVQEPAKGYTCSAKWKFKGAHWNNVTEVLVQWNHFWFKRDLLFILQTHKDLSNKVRAQPKQCTSCISHCRGLMALSSADKRSSHCLHEIRAQWKKSGWLFFSCAQME